MELGTVVWLAKGLDTAEPGAHYPATPSCLESAVPACPRRGNGLPDDIVASMTSRAIHDEVQDSSSLSGLKCSCKSGEASC